MSDIETQPEAPARPAETAVKPRRKSLVREYGEAIVVAVLLALLIRAFVVQAFTIPSGSMMDTLLVGDYILVNKFLYGPEIPFTDAHLPGLRDPRRGDIIVFKYPNDETRDFIKRIRLHTSMQFTAPVIRGLPTAAQPVVTTKYRKFNANRRSFDPKALRNDTDPEPVLPPIPRYPGLHQEAGPHWAAVMAKMRSTDKDLIVPAAERAKY